MLSKNKIDAIGERCGLARTLVGNRYELFKFAKAIEKEVLQDHEPVTPEYVLDWVYQYAMFEDPHIKSPLYATPQPPAECSEIQGRLVEIIKEQCAKKAEETVTMEGYEKEIAREIRTMEITL